MTKIAQESAALPSREEVETAVRKPGDRTTTPRQRQMFGQGGKLSVGCKKLQEAGYYCHWLNDYPNRINEAQANGYEFVSPEETDDYQDGHGVGTYTADSTSTKVSRIVGTNDQGDPLLAYLMKIRQEWKAENDAFHQRRPDAIDQEIRSGTLGGGVENAYQPAGGTRYTRS
jgi:hypothetical protein